MTGVAGEVLRPVLRLAPAVRADARGCDEGLVTIAAEREPWFLVSVDVNCASSGLGTYLGLPCYR